MHTSPAQEHDRVPVEQTPTPRAVALFAVALSMCVHLGILVILAMVVLAPPAPQAAGKDSETSLAILSEVDLANLQEAADSVKSPEFSMPEPEDPFKDRTSEVTIDLATNLLSPDVPDGLGGVRDADLGEGLDSALGGQGAASFFGVEARGSRFAYIVDVSGSMAGERIEGLRRELAGSVLALQEQAQFTIVVYNSQSFSLTDGKWWPATESSKSKIRTEISGLQATGATVPLPAFEMVFAMRPRPDAVYFMTDGEFVDNDEVIATIARLNGKGSRPTPIHCITFVDDGAAETMKKIARRSRGTYRHVPAAGVR